MYLHNCINLNYNNLFLSFSHFNYIGFHVFWAHSEARVKPILELFPHLIKLCISFEIQCCTIFFCKLYIITNDWAGHSQEIHIQNCCVNTSTYLSWLIILRVFLFHPHPVFIVIYIITEVQTFRSFSDTFLLVIPPLFCQIKKGVSP